MKAKYLPGRILAKRAASPTVTLLDLSIPSLQFQPGQWLDFCIPTADWIGGFSIASGKRGDNVQIAVKNSETHAPAQWVTNESKAGDDILVQVGGTCLLHASSTAPAVFVAGGIGISPLLGLYRQHVAEERPPVKFFYSVPNQNEIVFQEELLQLLLQPRTQDSLTITLTQATEWKQRQSTKYPVNMIRQLGRTMTAFLDAPNNTDNGDSSTVYYVCGPPTMQEEALERLRRSGVSSDRLVYEKWW